MKAFNIFLCMTMVMALLVQQGAGWWFRLGWRKRIIVAAKCYLAGCFTKQQIGELCEGVQKAMIKREEWQATEPRQVLGVNGMANNIILWHTGPDTCKVMGLSGSNCQRCIQDEACMKQLLATFQAADLGK
ncbi:hypothetical protein LSH36_1170g00086 [Paralvinella palmiformis]|uniref:Uncharacterized protein n=1 Tax=Paralvinella palmiformis TaxID=53620 RepID=A0AAD9IU72_9ANNE|nr:hypothetical protein LSH36_1170g00086 [Paralvinella palmiformis]